MRILWVLVVLLLVPAASACTGAGGANVAPLLDLQFTDKKLCKDREAHKDCTPLPEVGKSFEMEGLLTWQWALDNCEAGKVSADTSDYVVTFPPFPRNPSYMTLKIAPEEIHITAADQYDVTDDKVDPATGKYTIYEEYPVHVTITRTGEPNATELERLATKDWVPEIYAKAESPGTPAYQPGFTFEVFRFDGFGLQAMEKDSAKSSTPMPPLGLALVALAVAAFATRRRTA